MKDKNLLVKFKKAIRYNGPVKIFYKKEFYSKKEKRIIKGGWYCKILICHANQLIYDLKKYFNIIPAKSLILQPPHIKNKEHVQHFLRGYFDGDGSISLNNSKKNHLWNLSLSSSKLFLEWVKKIIKCNVPNTGNPSIFKPSGIHCVSYGGQQVKFILNWLYRNSDRTIYLVRKFKRYQKVLKIYNNKPNYKSRYLGITWHSINHKWQARIQINKKRISLGCYTTEIAAIKARKKALKFYGVSNDKLSYSLSKG